MNNKFEIGNLVILKSELKDSKAPKMVVEKVIGDVSQHNGNTVTCIYWSEVKGRYLKQDFIAMTLSLFSASSPAEQ